MGMPPVGIPMQGDNNSNLSAGSVDREEQEVEQLMIKPECSS